MENSCVDEFLNIRFDTLRKNDLRASHFLLVCFLSFLGPATFIQFTNCLCMLHTI